MESETKHGTAIGLLVVVVLAVLNATPAAKRHNEPTATNQGALPRISVAAPN